MHASPLDKEATLAIVPQNIWHVDAVAAKASPAWTGGEILLRAGGPVLFEYSFESLAGRGLSLPRMDSVRKNDVWPCTFFLGTYVSKYFWRVVQPM